MQKPKADPRAALADEYGRLDAELAPVRAKLRRFESLAKLLRSSAADEPDERPLAIAGAEFEVVLSACALRTVIATNPKLYRRLGKETFLAIATVTLKALEESVHPLTVAELVRTERSGPRKIDVRLIANSSELIARKAA